MIPSSELLTALVSACSSHKACVVTESETHEHFSECLNESVRRQLSASDQNALRLIRESGQHGLIESRARNENTSQKHFAKASRLLETLTMSTEARMLAESLLGAQQAYYWYRRRNYKKAQDLLIRSFDNDIFLENENSYLILRMHRIQLLNNLMRMSVRQCRFHKALTIGNAILTDLELPAKQELSRLPSPWNKGWNFGVSGVSINLLAAMHHQVAAEQVNVLKLMAQKRKSEDELRRILVAVRGECDNTQAYLWTSFQLALVDSSFGDPFMFACDMLRRGTWPSEPLWRSVVETTRSLLEQIDSNFLNE